MNLVLKILKPSKYLKISDQIRIHEFGQITEGYTVFKINSLIYNSNLHDTSGFATTHVVVSVRHPITY